jgi:hypothetical protein
VNIVWCQNFGWIDRFIAPETVLDHSTATPQKTEQMIERLLAEMKAEQRVNRVKMDANLKKKLKHLRPAK